MPDFTIEPLERVGPVRLGMSRADVRQVMSEHPKPFLKSQTSRYETDTFHQSAFHVYYCGDVPTVEYIELFRDSGIRALYRGIDVFETPADEVVAHISHDSAFDQDNPEFPYSYLFRGLEMSLWRPTIPESDRDPEGRFFSTIGIGIKGYYELV